MRSLHTYIPVPNVVLERQTALRNAREVTAKMYGGNNKPYELDSHEYIYFVGKIMEGLSY